MTVKRGADKGLLADAALRDPEDPEHEGAVKWLGTDFDPEAFNASVDYARLRPKPRPKRSR
ncbi:MAG TPA: hypothetical protein V6D05_03135 [Stenomitos sp.]